MRRRVPASTGRPAGAPRSSPRCVPPSAATSASVSCRPIASLRYDAASSAVKRRSAARTSTSSPRARSRASGRGGSARLAITRCSCGGRWSSRKAIAVVDLARLDDVVVVEDQHDVTVDGPEVVDEGGEHRLHRQRLGCLEEVERAGAHRRGQRPQPGDDVGPEVRRVVVARVQGQPRGRALRPSAGVAASHSVSSVVLPKPAGADTSTAWRRSRGPGARSGATAAPARPRAGT